MLIEAGGSKELIAEGGGTESRLGHLCSLAGRLGPRSCNGRFNEFNQRRQGYGGPAREFINLLVEELTANGVMEPDRLYQTPYIDIKPTWTRRVSSSVGAEVHDRGDRMSAACVARRFCCAAWRLFSNPRVGGFVVVLARRNHEKALFAKAFDPAAIPEGPWQNDYNAASTCTP